MLNKVYPLSIASAVTAPGNYAKDSDFDVITIDNFSTLIPRALEPMNRDIYENKIQSGFILLRDFITDIYMKPLVTFDMNYTDIGDKDNSEFILKIICNKCKRLKNRYRNLSTMTWKINFKDGMYDGIDRVIHFYIRFQSVPTSIIECQILLVQVLGFYEVADHIISPSLPSGINTCVACNIIISCTDNRRITSGTDLMFASFDESAVRTKFDKYTKDAKSLFTRKVITDQMKRSIYVQTMHAIGLISSLNAEDDEENKKYFRNANHSSFEMSIIPNILSKEAKSRERMISFHIDTWRQVSSKGDDCDNSFIGNNIDVPLNVFPIDGWAYTDRYKYPVADLSMSERKFIKKYVDKINLFTDEPEGYNLVPAITNLRYGSEFIYLFYVDGVRVPMYTDIMYDAGYDKLAVIIAFPISASLRGVYRASFDDISKFVYPNAFKLLKFDIVSIDGDGLVGSHDDMLKMIPDPLKDKAFIMDMIEELLSFHVIIKDRPARTRMVNITYRNPNFVRRKSSNPKYKEPEFIVTHILKSNSDAKAYVQKLSSNQQYRQCTYTLGSWERRGHYRRIPGTDEYIWIEPTTCTRHLPLDTNKEIHVKL